MDLCAQIIFYREDSYRYPNKVYLSWKVKEFLQVKYCGEKYF